MKAPEQGRPDQLTGPAALVACAVLTVVLELVTCGCRFGLGLQSTRDTGWISAFTFGFRIHHGYIGVLFIAVALLAISKAGFLRRLVIVVGAALLLSDLIHHFLVLWPLTGDPQFDIRYR
ncbi:MAG: hypothetical protein Aurels2KO_41760 [Aureliella sp.]